MARFVLALALWGGLAAAPAFAWTDAERQTARAGTPVTETLPADEGGHVRTLFFAAAPPAVAKAVLWDHARFVEFMPNARRSTILSHRPGVDVVEQVGGQGPFNVTIVTERKLETDRIVWRTLSGDVKANEGSWRFEATPGGTLLTYDVHVVPKGPVPGTVTAFLQRQALPGMIRAVRARIESRNPGPPHPP